MDQRKVFDRFARWEEMSFLFLFLLCYTATGQTPSASNSALSQYQELVEIDKGAFENDEPTTQSFASSWFDVTYDSLALDVNTQTNFLNGEVTIVGICREAGQTTLTLDLNDAMHIDSVYVNGSRSSFMQDPFSFNVTLGQAPQTGDALRATIFYSGYPVATGFGSIVFNTHAGVPWVYSLSEPYGARDWWPCKNDQSDKADSADIVVTCDSAFRVGSEGVLLSVKNFGNGKTAYHWHESYPIASYLISIAISNYAQLTYWFHYSPTDSMEVLNYILPEDVPTASRMLPLVLDMLKIYSGMYGRYPFIREKYGHSEFGIGGMEHQTMTSISTFVENIVAHELAHQWFGDMITCRTWSDLWLHEGFAQYSTALYLEKEYGVDQYWNYMKTQMASGISAVGFVGAPDTSTPKTLFYAPLVYGKGASILHMLRHVLGDSVFFRAMYAYANDPRLMYSNAASQDFERNCEEVSGKNLSYFFQEWLYGEGFPDYQYTWDWKSSGGSGTVSLNITQAPDRINPAFFTMPIDVKISTAEKETTVTVFNNAQSQNFAIDFPENPTSVTLDPDGWILKLAAHIKGAPLSEAQLVQNYPNPFNSSTKITYSIPKAEHVNLSVFNLLGQRVSTIVDAKQFAGTFEYQWSPGNLASGMYIFRLTAGDSQIQKKMILLR
ncbi:MAG TPA: M1 family aminopeptidase [Bacteroidota bacterium]|nr:M1 family aminopeptidase [Bacteroidota bacterium]